MTSIVKATVYDPEDTQLISVGLGPGTPSVLLTFTYDEEQDDGTDDDADGLTLTVTAGGGPSEIDEVIGMLYVAAELLEAAAGYDTEET